MFREHNLHLQWYCQYAHYGQSAHFCITHPGRINTGESRNSQSPLSPWQDLTRRGNFRKKRAQTGNFAPKRAIPENAHYHRFPCLLSRVLPSFLSIGKVLQGSGNESGLWLGKSRKGEGFVWHVQVPAQIWEFNHSISMEKQHWCQIPSHA